MDLFYFFLIFSVEQTFNQFKAKGNDLTKKHNLINFLRYSDNPALIKLTNDNFFLAFALEDFNTYADYIDETIYVPKVKTKIFNNNKIIKIKI